VVQSHVTTANPSCFAISVCVVSHDNCDMKRTNYMYIHICTYVYMYMYMYLYTYIYMTSLYINC